ncbi:Rrf2 family transcriptional regulator [Glutamicibacter sp. MNS18]|uniref:RrF2 family transcriptional regulator n=1 Tax=Glutamicibacter sp. MNS18 TaxID=2989817 RepID=UPI002236BF81|nr:Rrf2 family transcriptional regulator [Glutamicibacter sp. MNS18]MCW4466866.1 Rrf2 family transcriptional regulator [Glutamicibacter sp. MNS18]
MRLSAYTDVCLRTLMVLGARGGQRLTSREISELIDIPYNHVTKAVLELGNLGALDVTRGRYGGASITEAGLRMSLGELLRTLDWREDVVDCTTHDALRDCPLSGGCRLRSALRQARDAFYNSLDSLTVAEVVENSSSLTRLPFPQIRPAG